MRVNVSAVAPTMKEQGSGKIITVSSQAGRRASTDGGYAHYGTAKAGILGLTRALAAELAPHNIQVNAILPGPVDGPRLRGEPIRARCVTRARRRSW